MKPKELNQASAHLKRINELDIEIADIEKTAMVVANGETKSSIKLSVEDLEKTEEEENKVEFDEDGSLVDPDKVGGALDFTEMYRSMRVGHIFQSRKDAIKSIPQFTHEKEYYFTPYVTLEILGRILHEKNLERKILTKKLKKFGVQI